MPRLSQVFDQPVTPEVAALFEDICRVKGVGRPPGFMRVLAGRPDIAGSVWRLLRLLLTEGQLPASVQEMMVLAMSAQANCRYCVVAHQRSLESMGIGPDVVARCVSDPATLPIPELHRRLVLFSLKAARDPNAVTDADVSQLRELGLSEGEFVEVAITVALTRLLNTWASATGIPVDPAEEPARGGLA